MELTQVELIEKAEQLGIEIDLLEDYATDNILLTHQGKAILFSKDGAPLNQLSCQAFYIANDKQYCKRIFEKLGISHPKSIIFNQIDTEMSKIRAFMKQNELYVCKPLDGTEGEGVCMNIQNLNDLNAAWNQWKHKYSCFILEEQKDYGDLRIQVIAGKIVAACVREPASVIGDGASILSDLVKAQNKSIQKNNPANKLELDTASMELIKKQDLSLDSIPPKGQKVVLKYVANMNQGALAIDITDQIHPDYQLWIEKLAKELELRIFALDVLTKDYRLAPTEETAWALEINAMPYWFHHTFSEVRQHDIASMILKDVFEID